MCFQHPERVFIALQAIMGTQVTIERQERPKEYKTIEEVRAELEAHGIRMEEPHQLQYYKGPLIELDADDVTTDTIDQRS
jgi:hypothetical protein